MGVPGPFPLKLNCLHYGKLDIFFYKNRAWLSTPHKFTIVCNLLPRGHSRILINGYLEDEQASQRQENSTVIFQFSTQNLYLSFFYSLLTTLINKHWPKYLTTCNKNAPTSKNVLSRPVQLTDIDKFSLQKSLIFKITVIDNAIFPIYATHWLFSNSCHPWKRKVQSKSSKRY